MEKMKDVIVSMRERGQKLCLVGVKARHEVGAFDLEGKKSAVRAWDDFACLSEPAKAPAGDDFFRGHLAGMFEGVYEARAKVVETKRVLTGSDRCELAVIA